MFANNRGTTVLPVDTSAQLGPLYWVATKNETTVQMKLANYGPDEQTVNVDIADTKSGDVEVLAGGQKQGNLPHQVSIVPEKKKVHSETGKYKVVVPAWGIAVLAVE